MGELRVRKQIMVHQCPVQNLPCLSCITAADNDHNDHDHNDHHNDHDDHKDHNSDDGNYDTDTTDTNTTNACPPIAGTALGLCWSGNVQGRRPAIRPLPEGRFDTGGLQTNLSGQSPMCWDGHVLNFLYVVGG